LKARLALARMPVSRLLKSWAAPPARIPRLSSCWGWRDAIKPTRIGNK
jgi:hypothetical protein